MNFWIVYGLVVIVGMVVGGATIWYFLLHDWLRCDRCRIRLASIDIFSDGGVTESDARRYGEDVKYLGAKVCSTCWDSELSRVGFTVQFSWFPGAFTEYVKNTPAFLAVILSTVALVLSLINFFGE